MPGPSDIDLYRRGVETAIASWAAIASGSRDSAVVRAPGVAAAVFPHEHERSVYNNAVLEHGLGPGERAAAIDAMEAAYAAAKVTSFAAWIHETDGPMRSDLEARGYAIAETTRAMGMALADIGVPPAELDLAPSDWHAYTDFLTGVGVPAGLLRDVDPAAFHLLMADCDGRHVATALGFDAGDDIGIFNVSTVEGARRRGLGTALTARLAHDALARGRTTATLQSTPMAERVYAAVGFRDLGRILELAPAPR
jgi:GNAT superfamily N-acetyltransferase